MFQELFFAFWFFAPAGTANMFAFLSKKIPGIKKYSYPVDGGLTFRGKRILGSHKTIRGFVVGTIAAIIVAIIQVFLYTHLDFVQKLVGEHYTITNPVLFGFLSGFGALFGDAVKSFFKRQIAIKPGESWVPFDQIDYILGGMVFTWVYFPLNIWRYLLILIVWVLIHPTVNFLGFLFRLKRNPL